MTREQALELLSVYSDLAEGDTRLSPIEGASERFPADGSEAKSMRWLGWAQGYIEAMKVASRDEIKAHSRAAGMGISGPELRRVVFTDYGLSGVASLPSEMLQMGSLEFFKLCMLESFPHEAQTPEA